MPAETVIRVRQGTAAQWTSMNPALAAGEQGYETDTGRTKIGNGTLAWNSLGYAGVPNNTMSLLFGNVPGAFTRRAFSSGTNVVMTNGFMRTQPHPIFETITLDQVQLLNIASGGSTGSVARLGLYDSDSRGLPRNLIADWGTVDTTTLGAKTLTGLNRTLQPGLYHFAFVAQGAPATNPTVRTEVTMAPFVWVDFSAFTSIFGIGSYKTGITGALPSSLTWTSTDQNNSDNQPAIRWKWL